jgi:2-polyprenyl-3-methyl-5-hydroxy-6-metoxy-1,4-benzoquinol methylase
MEHKSPHTPEQLRDGVRQIWDDNADFWDARMGEGNDFHKRLIEPAQLRLLNLRGGEAILDLACGNGQFARKMADSGTKIVAVDAAPRMIENAKSRSAGYENRIEYHVVDCTDRARLLALGTGQFDRVVCTMALMDISDIEPLISASAQLLCPSGHLVFSILHPCFNSGLWKQGMEQHERDGQLVDEYFVRVTEYSKPLTTMGVAMSGQPVQQFYFHRSLSDLFALFFQAGFVLDGFEEPAFGPKANPSFFDKVFEQIPPALVGRMRRKA